ncbi:MAG: hypothetical protein JW913_20625 [Chitinispirillaceae bacterium]|nr:hypothetical protein [Chitinispirillaceae bacterium]
MYANCCGTHLLDIAVIADKVITITRIDTGALCACHCPFEFIVNIPECEADSYHVRLTDYWGDSLDTLILRGAPTATNRFPTGSFNNTNHRIIGTGEALFDIQGRFLG